MPPVTSYNPLVSCTINDIGPVPLPGLTVIVGPNSSGKTQLLKDLLNAVLMGQRPDVVCVKIEAPKPDSPQDIVEELRKAGYVSVTDHKSHSQWELIAPMFGMNKEAKQKTANSRDFLQGTKDKQRHLLDFVGPVLITGLFIENRLTAINKTKSFVPAKASPQNDVQALFKSLDAKKTLNKVMAKHFGKQLAVTNAVDHEWIDIRVVPGTEPLTDEDTDYSVLAARQLIDDEGDGMRSFAAIAIAVLLGSRPLCLIDEPELCLHPPQAYAIGRFIGEHAAAHNNATVVATHSSQVLRGLVEATTDVQIIRLTHPGNVFIGHRIDAATLKECVRKPMARKEIVFDGLFADAAVIVESEGDRDVYQCVLNLVESDTALEAHFVPVGGLGQIAEPLRFYRAMKLPATVIADLDLLTNEGTLNAILTATRPDLTEDIASIIAKVKQLCAELKKEPRAEMQSSVNAELSALSEQTINWAAGDDRVLVETLRRLARRIEGVASLKKGVAIRPDGSLIKTLVDQLIGECKKFKVFLVPVGVLEHWEPDLMEGISKSPDAKQLWANEAVIRINNNRDRIGDLSSFVSEIAAQLTQ